MGNTCMHVESEKCTQNFLLENLEGRHLRNPDVNGRTLLSRM